MRENSRVARRTVLKAGLIGVPSVLAAGAGWAGWQWASADIDTAGKVSFTNRLYVPPLAQSARDSAGRRVFNLRAAPGRRRLRPGRPTEIWGLNGPMLGPTLRAARGETVQINVRNDLPETTTLHWHVMHLPARMDGGPHQPIAPGATWSPHWTIDQPAATLWYHPHPHGRTARHVYRGLVGMFMEFRSAARLEPAPAPPGRLAAAPALASASAPVTRTFELSGFRVNGRRMDMNRIDFGVVRNTTEIWEITAIDSRPHNFHVHDVQFQVLSIGGAPPPPELRGRKDTVYAPNRKPVRIALRFGEYTDPRTPYMYHCHLLYHEDQGLMGQFVVTEPGRTPQAPPSVHHH